MWGSILSTVFVLVPTFKHLKILALIGIVGELPPAQTKKFQPSELRCCLVSRAYRSFRSHQSHALQS